MITLPAVQTQGFTKRGYRIKIAEINEARAAKTLT
jgi:hypothetical protein